MPNDWFIPYPDTPICASFGRREPHRKSETASFWTRQPKEASQRNPPILSKVHEAVIEHAQYVYNGKSLVLKGIARDPPREGNVTGTTDCTY